MRRFPASPSLLLAAALAPWSTAAAAPRHLDGGNGGGGGADCSGTPGYVLDMPTCAAIGSTVDVCLTGPANAFGTLFASLGQGPTPTKCGTLCLDFPALLDVPFLFDAEGHWCFETLLPEDVELVGTVIYAQFMVCKPDAGVSNQASLEIIDDLAVGDFVTFTQEEIGVRCEGFGGPACRLADAFSQLFPGGIVLGDQDGIDGDGEYAIVFTSADAVAKFLPDHGPIAPLEGDVVDPLETPAGAFAAELLTAKINFALDLAGNYDDLKRRDCRRLGDLEIARGVNRDLIGFEVADFIAVCDLALSGALGEGDLDVNGDGELDAYLGDLSDALNTINKNFDTGGINLGNMKYR